MRYASIRLKRRLVISRNSPGCCEILARIGVSEDEAAAMSCDEMLSFIYEREPNPYTAYRRPGEPKRGFWDALKDWLFSRPSR